MPLVKAVTSLLKRLSCIDMVDNYNYHIIAKLLISYIVFDIILMKDEMTKIKLK